MARRSGLTFTLAMLLVLAGCAPRVVASGPADTVPHMTDDSFIAVDGARLPMRRWLPVDKPRAVIVAVHGFNDYGNAFAMPGPWFAERGIAAVAYDQRGFGAAPHHGLWAGATAMTGDLGAITAAVASQHPGIPLYLLGDSMGGAVVMTALAGKDPPATAGAILVAPAVWGRATMPVYQRAALWLAAHTVPWLTLSGRGLKRRASDNIEMLRALGRDPLIIKATRIDVLWGLTNLMDDALAAAPKLTAPALILYGRNDEIIPPEPVTRMLDSIPADARVRQQVTYYDSGWHMLLRDLGREAVWRDILSWIDAQDSPQPPQTIPAPAATGGS